MGVFRIKKGYNLKFKGAPKAELISLEAPTSASINPQEFRGIKARLAVKEGDKVSIGSPLLYDKNNEQLKIASPLKGTVKQIVRGERRVLQEVLIEADREQAAVDFKPYNAGQIGELTKEQVIEHMLVSGLWAFMRQRPFSKIANPADNAKSIFIKALHTEPHAPQMSMVLNGETERLQTGIDVLSRLGLPIHLCYASGDNSAEALKNAKGATHHQFSGPHPAGNISTMIHHVDPINKGDVVWYIDVQDVLRLATLFTHGRYDASKVISICGAGPQTNAYAKTIIGAPIANICQSKTEADLRYISGNILSGKTVGREGALGLYDQQISVLKEVYERKMVRFMRPGFDEFSLINAFASTALGAKNKEQEFTTDGNGSLRAIVANDIYDRYVPLDIMTYFLLKAVIFGDIEESEKLGILECDEEDFALCTFACASKVDVGGIIRQGLDAIEKEG